MITVRKRQLIIKLIFGMIFLLNGLIVEMMDAGLIGVNFTFVICVLLLIMISIIIYFFVKKRKDLFEHDDEISIENSNLATARMADIMVITIILINLLLDWLGINIIFNSTVLFTFLGLFNIGEYIIFNKLETQEDKGDLKTNIYQICIEKGIDLEELAKDLDIRQETIKQIEKGTCIPSLQLAIDIARLLDKSVEEIFEFEKD